MHTDPQPPIRARAGIRATLVAVAAVALFAAGCATLFEREERDPFQDDRILIRVVNDNFYDVTIHAVWDGHRERVGRVMGNRTEVFPLPARGSGASTLAVSVSVQAGGTFTTNQITAWPGEEITVRVPPDLDRR